MKIEFTVPAHLEDDRIKHLLTDVAKAVGKNMEADHDNVDVQIECKMVKKSEGSEGFEYDYEVIVHGEEKKVLVARADPA
jgi:hypothetical protein